MCINPYIELFDPRRKCVSAKRVKSEQIYQIPKALPWINTYPEVPCPVFVEDEIVLVHLREKYPFPFDGKILFRESTHTYAMKDDDGKIYTQGIKSVSGLMGDDKDTSGLEKAAMYSVFAFRKNIRNYLLQLQSKPSAGEALTYNERHGWVDGGNLNKLTMDYLSKPIYRKLETGQDLTRLEQMEWYGALLACDPSEKFNFKSAKSFLWEGCELIDWSFIRAALDDEAFMEEYYASWRCEDQVEESDYPKWPFDARSVRKKWCDWRNAGTALHAYVEYTLNLVDDPPFIMDEPEIERRQVELFLEKHVDTEWIRTELRVGSLEHRLCGTMDALAWINGQYVIFDWKRSRNVRNPETGVNGRSFESYQFQLTAYKKLLALNGIETADVGYLVVFHPIYPTFQEIEVNLLTVRDKVEEAFQKRVQELTQIYSQPSE